MQFEQLPNELLLDLFEFLDAVHLLRAFSGLNSRLNTLLFTHLQAYQLDLRFISKSYFTNICQNHLPVIIDRVISLHLSEDETPTLPSLLLSSGFTLNRFIHLKKLSLCRIWSSNKLKELLIQCKSLLCLTHLNVIMYDNDPWNRPLTNMFTIDPIWDLPKLTHCNLSGIDPSQSLITSYSIEYLSIKSFQCNFSDLLSVLKCTPHLRRICVNISGSTKSQLKTVIPRLISLNIRFQGPSQSLINLLQNMPNLSHLTIEIDKMYLNGYEWEELFVNYLTKIKIFRMKMNFNFSSQNNTEEQMDELLHSFQTHFWLEERQWFVRCDVTSSGDSSDPVILYTLPYAFENFIYSNQCLSKSTCPNDKYYWSSYDRVRVLGYDEQENKRILKRSIQYSPSFQNIQHLVTPLTCSTNFLSCISSLNQLISLDVSLCNGFAYSQLENLLHRAPRIDSLTLTSPSPIRSTLFQMKNIAIRRLFFVRKNCKLDVSDMNYLNSNDDTDVPRDALINSPFRMSCEVLAIEVKFRRNIVSLINAFINLRLLIVKCEDDKWIHYPRSDDECVDWLRCNLPSTCSVMRHMRPYILIWIG
jgi:hypothetical protein